MANPFLMMDEEIVTQSGNDLASNPFLMQDGQADNEFDNPFVGQATNPFAEFGDDANIPQTSTTTVSTEAATDIFSTEPMAARTANSFQPIDAAMSFFGTTIEHDDENMSMDIKHPQLSQLDDANTTYSSEEELTKKKGPPPRPTPPSQQTQELIFAVTDQLDQASSHLLGRLPATRTPSPVSMRDLHSPSPTPETAMDDLLDVSDSSRAQPNPENEFDVDFIESNADNPFASSISNMQTDISVQQAAKTQPPRPPPPRPAPPRPTPPSVPTAPVQVNPIQNIIQFQQNQEQEPDLFDMFGDIAPPPKQPTIKTKEDILSLFSAPKPTQQQNTQPDLLSGDILLDDIPSSEAALPPPLTEALSQPTMPTMNAAPVIDQTQLASSMEDVQPPVAEEEKPVVMQDEIQPILSAPQATYEQPTTTVTEPEQVEGSELNLEEVPKVEEDDTKVVMDSITPEVTYKRAPTPDIEITTVESLPRSDDEEEIPPLEQDVQKVESFDEVVEEPIEPSIMQTEIAADVEDVQQTEIITEPEKMDIGLDFAPSIPSGATSANPFASPEEDEGYPATTETTGNIFGNVESAPAPAPAPMNIFAVDEPPIVPQPTTNIFAEQPAPMAISQTDIFGLGDSLDTTPKVADEFDAFAAKFDSAKKDNVSLLDGFGGVTPTAGGDAWGDTSIFATDTTNAAEAFGTEDGFDSFLAMKAPQQDQSFTRKDSVDSMNEEKEFNVVIRPKEADVTQGLAPVLAPPPPTRGSQNNSIYSGDSSPRINPFDRGDEVASADGIPAVPEPASMVRTDSQETPPTPLFDEDVSQPLEDFPRVIYTGSGWEMQLRQPNKKKITGQRFWKKIFIKLVYQGDNPVLQLYNQATDKDPFQELPLQPCYSVSDIGAQQYDQFGKIFTIKLQYIFYKERPGVRPGQVTKAERITNKLSQFAAYAIQGDYQGVKEFGSDLKKLGLPVEHAPQISQLFKIGSMSYEDLKQFSVCIEEALFKLTAHRDRALTYKFEEVQITVVDELYVEQEAEGHVNKQIARVRLFFLGFLSGMPSIELGLNDLWRQGKEVVGRHDIIPVVTEEWIRLEGVEFHNCVQQDEYERSRTIKFQPPDACYIELMRFRVRPPKNRELPLQLKATWCVTGNRVELRADVLVPGFASRKLGQIPCEDVAIRFPIPECWIYLFRVEKHFRYGSVKSAHRRTGKIKGIERILGTVDTLQESLIEVTSGQAKYEHQHRSIVWRCPRLPKEGQGAYTTHQLVCRMALTSYDQIPEQLAPYCYVEFTMPATQVSHTTVRSVSVQESDSDEPPEKYVRYLARHEYRVGIESTTGESTNPYLAATRVKEESPAPQPVSSPMAPSDSDSESN